MKILLFLILLCCYTSLCAQINIRGLVVDSLGHGIDNVSVTYRKKNNIAILGYTMTKGGGLFRLEPKVQDMDSIELSLSHLSYRKNTVVIANRSGEHTFRMTLGHQQLKEVSVGQVPIFRRKDTINYNVEAFTTKQDRVIGDIIRKLPGVEMIGDKILYQGKPIQKYKVNNLDLMEGRYGMINNNLPADVVKKIQVVENDQPIKILDSLVISDRASLNLELRKFTTTGTGRVGVGAAPLLWEVNLTPMTFGRTFQMLHSLQSNNTGDDVSRQLARYYTGGGFFANSRTDNSEGPSYLEIRDVSSPGFDQKKWLDNRIFLWNTNLLQKLRNGVEVKGNISYYNDLRKRAGRSATTIFAPDQDIVLTEAVDNRYRINDLSAGILIERNEKQIYLRNNLLFHKRWNADRGELLFNEDALIGQSRTYNDASLMNSLSLTRFLGRQLVSFSSTVEYTETPQWLSVTPGQMEYILNGGDPYDRMQQHVNARRWNTDNKAAWTRKYGRLTLSPEVSIGYEQNRLRSRSETTENGISETLGTEYQNDNRTAQLKMGANIGFSYERDKWKLFGSVPYRFQVFDASQRGHKVLDASARNTFNPSASMRYTLDPNHELTFNGSWGTKFGELHDLYGGYIINSYRSLQRYDTRLLANTNLSTALRYDYKNTLKANFANFGYSYNQGRRDYIFNSSVDSQGRTTIDIQDRNSTNWAHSITAGFNRFFSTAKTIVKVGGNATVGQSDYLLNESMSVQKQRSWDASLEVINTALDFFGVSYKTTYSSAKSILANEKKNTVMANNHYLELNLYPLENHSLSFTNALYRTNITGQKTQYFLDLMYRLSVHKRRIEIELSGRNLFNNSRYTQQFSTDFQLIESSFDLRPRQLITSVRFKF